MPVYYCRVTPMSMIIITMRCTCTGDIDKHKIVRKVCKVLTSVVVQYTDVIYCNQSNLYTNVQCIKTCEYLFYMETVT
jgi:hypothetical protein